MPEINYQYVSISSMYCSIYASNIRKPSSYVIPISNIYNTASDLNCTWILVDFLNRVIRIQLNPRVK